MINPVLALHIANPSELKKLVGFKVETFYHNGINGKTIVFWEALENDDIGRIKKFNSDSFNRKCLEVISRIKKETQ